LLNGLRKGRRSKMDIILSRSRLAHLASMPGLGHATVSKGDLQQILLDTGGEIMASGELWEITSKHLGVGVYRVSTKRKDR
jgi:hypothetical protein